MKKLICYFIVICSSITFSAASNAVLPLTVVSNDIFSLAPLVEKVSPAVVNISISGSQLDPQALPDLFDFFSDQDLPPPSRTFIGLGSGVIIDASKGYIITNFHVIAEADEIKIMLKSGQEFNALLVGKDKKSDIALLQINTNKTLTEIELADSDKLRVGDIVIAIGNPFGLGQTVTSGIISALGRSGLNVKNLENFIQTDAAINSGNSGGALINLKGELIGINTALIGSSGGNIGIGFAIPANMITNLVPQLVQFGEIRRGILGIRGGELTNELTKTFALDSKHGAFIYQVNPDSAAQQAGLQVGDVIISLNGQQINSFSVLRAKIGSLGVGKNIELDIIRDGQKKTISATLKAAQPNKITLDRQTFHRSLRGVTLIDQQDKNKKQGILVSEIEKQSIAENYGLRQGDVIIGINRIRIRNLSELKAFISNSSKIVTLNVLRNNRQLSLMVNF